MADIARMLEITSKLGRLATGLGTDGERRKGDDLPAGRVEVTVAREEIYGEPLPGEVTVSPPTLLPMKLCRKMALQFQDGGRISRPFKSSEILAFTWRRMN